MDISTLLTSQSAAPQAALSIGGQLGGSRVNGAEGEDAVDRFNQLLSNFLSITAGDGVSLDGEAGTGGAGTDGLALAGMTGGTDGTGATISLAKGLRGLTPGAGGGKMAALEGRWTQSGLNLLASGGLQGQDLNQDVVAFLNDLSTALDMQGGLSTSDGTAPLTSPSEEDVKASIADALTLLQGNDAAVATPTPAGAQPGAAAATAAATAGGSVIPQLQAGATPSALGVPMPAEGTGAALDTAPEGNIPPPTLAAASSRNVIPRLEAPSDGAPIHLDGKGAGDLGKADGTPRSSLTAGNTQTAGAAENAAKALPGDPSAPATVQTGTAPQALPKTGPLPDAAVNARPDGTGAPPSLSDAGPSSAPTQQTVSGPQGANPPSGTITAAAAASAAAQTATTQAMTAKGQAPASTTTQTATASALDKAAAGTTTTGAPGEKAQTKADQPTVTLPMTAKSIAEQPQQASAATVKAEAQSDAATAAAPTPPVPADAAASATPATAAQAASTISANAAPTEPATPQKTAVKHTDAAMQAASATGPADTATQDAADLSPTAEDNTMPEAKGTGRKAPAAVKAAGTVKEKADATPAAATDIPADQPIVSKDSMEEGGITNQRMLAPKQVKEGADNQARTELAGAAQTAGQVTPQARPDPTPLVSLTAAARSDALLSRAVSAAGKVEESGTATDTLSLSSSSSSAEQASGAMAAMDGGKPGAADFTQSLRQATTSHRPSAYAPPAMQVAVQVQQAADEGNDRISIQLTPHDLGKIEVQLEFGAGGKLRAKVMAENPQTLEMLQKDAKGLEKALQDAGLNTDASSLSFSLQQDNGDQAQQRQRDQGGSNYGTDLASTDAEDEDPAIIAQAQIMELGRVDVRV